MLARARRHSATDQGISGSTRGILLVPLGEKVSQAFCQEWNFLSQGVIKCTEVSGVSSPPPPVLSSAQLSYHSIKRSDK